MSAAFSLSKCNNCITVVKEKAPRNASQSQNGRGDKIRTCDFYVPNRKSPVK